MRSTSPCVSANEFNHNNLGETYKDGKYTDSLTTEGWTDQNGNVLTNAAANEVGVPGSIGFSYWALESGTGTGPVLLAQNTLAPNNQPQPQKKPCKATTRIGGVIKAADGYITATGMANLAALGYYGSFFIVGATCAPEPGVFVTCPAGLFAGGSLAGSATVMGYGAYKVATGEMIPGIKQAITCTETE